MIIGVFGESCTGKSALAEKIAASFDTESHDIPMVSGETDLDAVIEKVMKAM